MATPLSQASAVFADGVQDSPLFKQRANDLELAGEALLKRTKKLVISSSENYTSKLGQFAEASTDFASCLEEFCTAGSDEDSAAVGGPTILRFAHVLRELSTFADLLRTQVEVLIDGRLGEGMAAMQSEVRDAKRRAAQTAADYDAVRARHLGHSKGRTPWPAGKSGRPERSHADMVAARTAAEEARFELARMLAEAHGRRRYTYLESLASVMHGHLSYYKHCHDALQSLEPYINRTLDLADHLKGEVAAQNAALEEMIHSQKQADEARTISSGALDVSFTEQGENGIAGQPTSGSLAAPSGPLQMTATTAQLATELQSYITATKESDGTQIVVLKQGYLLKQSSKIKSKWQRRFFVLDSLGMLYYFSNKTERNATLGPMVGRDANGKDQRPTSTVSLLTATVKPGPPPDSPQVPFAFRLVSPEREYVLQAEDDAEAKQWTDVLQSTIACLLFGATSSERPAAVIRKPTHQRTSSVDMSAAAVAMTTAADTIAPKSTAAIEEDVTKSDSGLVASFPLGDGSSTASSPDKPIKGNRDAISPLPSPLRPDTFAVGLPKPPPAAAAVSTSPLEQLRASAAGGCADCGAPLPDWGSLNLGVVVCIECSAFHRQLGVHLSKVRSLLLDVKAWDASTLALFRHLGNSFANDVWEASLRTSSDSNAIGEEIQSDDTAAAVPLAALNIADSTSIASVKPAASAPAAAKERFIKAKYYERKFVQPPLDDNGLPVSNTELKRLLWEAVDRDNVRDAYRLLAAGADASQDYNGEEAFALMKATNIRAGGSEDEQPSNDGGTVRLLHLAVARAAGDPALLELLLQWGNGDALDAVDGFGRTPLAYGLVYDKPVSAKQLLQRGAKASGRALAGTQCAADEELVLLLQKNF